ncbi:hypothetical protein [Nocardia brasiliensis]
MKILRMVAILLVLLTSLLACGASDDAHEWPMSSETSQRTMESTTEPVPVGGTPTTDVRECYDGQCTLAVSGTQTIPLDPVTLSYPEMTVTVLSATTLVYHVDYGGGGGATAELGPGSTGNFGREGYPTIAVTWTSTGPTTANVTLTPR